MKFKESESLELPTVLRPSVLRWFHSPEGLWNLNAGLNAGRYKKVLQSGSTELSPLWNQHIINIKICHQFAFTVKMKT